MKIRKQKKESDDPVNRGDEYFSFNIPEPPNSFGTPVEQSSDSPLAHDEAGQGRATQEHDIIAQSQSKTIEPLPSRFHPIRRAYLKKEFVQKYLAEYVTPIKLADGSTHKPTTLEIAQYKKELETLSVEDLAGLNQLTEFHYKLQIRDRIKSINKKKNACVTIFNDNGSLDTFTVPVHSRLFSRDNKTYIIKGESGWKDPEIKMIHFFYFTNNPFPYVLKNHTLENKPDGVLLDNTIEFKVIEALANIEMSKLITICVVLSVLNFCLSVAAVIIGLKGFKMI